MTTPVNPEISTSDNTACLRQFGYVAIYVGAALAIAGIVSALALEILISASAVAIPVGTLAVIHYSIATMCVVGPLIVLVGAFVLARICEHEQDQRELAEREKYLHNLRQRSEDNVAAAKANRKANLQRLQEKEERAALLRDETRQKTDREHKQLDAELEETRQQVKADLEEKRSQLERRKQELNDANR